MQICNICRFAVFNWIVWWSGESLVTFLWHRHRADNHQVHFHLRIQANRHTEVFHTLKEEVQRTGRLNLGGFMNDFVGDEHNKNV